MIPAKKTTVPLTDARESLLPPEFVGVVKVAGLRGLGKTSFAVTADYPPNIVFYDFESKGAFFDKQLHFGHYVNVPSEVAKIKGKDDFKAEDVWDFLVKDIASLEVDRYTTVIFDTVADLEAALAGKIQQNPTKYGVKPQQQGGGWGGIYPAMSVQVANLIAKLEAKGIRVVIIVSHTKQAWTKAGPVPNKLKTQGVNEWSDRRILEIVLVPGEGKTPAGLVQHEQLASLTFDPTKGTFTFTPRLPLRLPQATWYAIREYMKNPANLAAPKEGEVPTEEEMAPYSEFYSQSQMDYLINAAGTKEEKTEVGGE